MKDPLQESRLRERLEIPPDAARVLVFGETSHWDPNWLYTSEEYFAGHIRQILDVALSELEREPRRVYSIECVFFLKMYWERCPEKREAVARLVNEGRLRLTGSGMTTPDTTLPETEAILRDYLRGQTWLRANGMTQRPRLAYFPDGFGHSPGVPAVLAASGFDYTAISRIDGMNFPATDFRRAWYYPRPGSNAWLLLKELRSLDFFWRSPDRSQVLAHWNCYTYFQGDNLVYVGPVKWMGRLYGIHRRSETHVAKRIVSFAAKLGPLSRTPYSFCPIGMDFNRPIPGLFELIARYNRRFYTQTGIYAVLAGLDDYLDLVSCHAEKLPVLPADFNPYWMGFWSSRPTLKQRIKNLTRDLLKTEKLTLLAQDTATARGGRFTAPDLSRAWDQLILSNHHDFITGTSPDRVYEKEQKTSVVEARTAVKESLRLVLEACPSPPLARHADAPRVETVGERRIIDSTFYTVELDGSSGGCITRWIEKATGREMLIGPGNDLVLYEDTGGLWRLGHEFRGGMFRVIDRAGRHPAEIDFSVKRNLLEVVIRSELQGSVLTRRLWFRNDSPAVRMKVEGTLPRRRTLTVRYATVMSPRSLTMDVVGGVVDRPSQKIFSPTFWPAKNFAHIKEQESDRGMAVGLYSPGSISADTSGVVEWVAMRNAPREIAWGFLPVLAHPARGHEPGDQSFDYAVWFTSSGDWRKNRVMQRTEEVLRPSWLRPEEPDQDGLADSLVTVDNGDVVVGAVKPADAGEGVVVRLHHYARSDLTVCVAWRGRPIRKAWLCSAREEDLETLNVTDGKAVVPLERAITSVRITF